MESLYRKAQKIDRLADYIESAGIPHDDKNVAEAAAYQLYSATSGESGRWEDAEPSEVAALRRFVNRYCKEAAS